MAFNIKQPFQQVNLPKINYQPNYRVLVASLLFLVALALLIPSCSEEKVDFLSASKKKGMNYLSASKIDSQPQKTSFFSMLQDKKDTQDTHNVNQATNQTYQTMDVAEYYRKNEYDVDDKIRMPDKVAAFFRHPPSVSKKRGYYKRYRKVKADFNKARKYRKKLEQLETKYHGRNQIISTLTPNREAAFRVEAQLFYQLEKIVYYAEESYYQWQAYKSYDPEELAYLERDALARSKQTATMFQDFSYALANYTRANQ